MLSLYLVEFLTGHGGFNFRGEKGGGRGSWWDAENEGVEVARELIYFGGGKLMHVNKGSSNTGSAPGEMSEIYIGLTRLIGSLIGARGRCRGRGVRLR